VNKPGAGLQALAGHVIDLYRLASFQVSNPFSYSKFRNIKALARRTGARVLIEAGTYRGVTTARCARIFERVYTIELDPALAAEAAQYLRKWPNVEAIQGDALKALPTLLKRPNVADVLLFLDGHFSAGDTAMGDLSEPVVEELSVLGEHKSRICGMIIDDFRGFGTYETWPAKSALLRAIEDHFPGYDVMIHLDQVIVARPPTAGRS
jgi:hypothetical protein